MGHPDSSLTPEKRLLKLIEEPGTAVAQAEGEEETDTAVDAPAPSIQSILSPSALLGRFSYFRDRFLAFLRNEGPPLNLKQVNKSIKIFTFGLAFYFAGALLYEFMTVGKDIKLKLDLSPRDIAEAPVPDVRRYDIDLFDDTERRNVFVPYVEKVEEVKEDAASVLSLKLLEITKDFKLTGISLDPDHPERTFRMVEDIKKDMTSFLRVGDSISGLTVAEIREDSIVLQYEKERIELR